MNKYHEIQGIDFINDNLHIVIDGKAYEFPLHVISKRLFNASDIERRTYHISSSGYGIHWKLIDEDLSIDGLLGIHHSPAFTNEVNPFPQ
ncbi:MAG: DUF2442 domain-containing protein [Chloroherpetonaceae bacterium]|nr:DUF2442 domain-containing protein [Chloroherpetonaceae bacterium]